MLSSYLIPLRIIQEKRLPKHLVTNHSHKYIHLICVETGNILVSCNNVWLDLYAGDLILVSPGTMHSIFTENGATSYELKFECTEKLIELKSTIEAQKYWLWEKTADVLPLLIKIMIEAKEGGPYSLEIIASQIYLILVLLLRAKNSTAQHQFSQDPLSYVELSTNELLNEAAAYIDKHILDDLSVQTIARHFGYSRNYFSTMFRNVFHISPNQYIMLKRIEYAKKLIRENTYSLTDVAEKLGFYSVQAFSSSFKKYCGLTPKQYSAQSSACTYINLTNSPLLPPDNVRDVEPISCEHFNKQQLLLNEEKA